MKKHLVLYIISATLLISCSNNDHLKNNSPLDAKVDSLLSLMTLEEKIGQMSQLSGDGEVTGPVDTSTSYVAEVKKGRVGSLLNINGVEYTRRMQKLAIEHSRLKIPLIFGYDVIHGYKTIFPVPLGEAASWDLDAMESSARIAAKEASAAGQHWTFAPMVDVSRDARWGRVMEGAGEDTYYGQLVAKSRVRGFQGKDLSDVNTIAACAKHYAGYGLAEGGKDYNTTEISDRTLREYILPPFKACIDENVATFMTAFNDLNGVPASGNKKLGDILRQEWAYDGMVVSDWNSIGEMMEHGIAEDEKEAALLALDAGIDMDMEGNVYSEELMALVKNGQISEEQINNAARRILKLKFELGLFEDPFRYCNTDREEENILTNENREIARDVARKSIVLLKNNNSLLPLKDFSGSIALIGPLANNKDDILGTWRARGSAENGVSILEGLKKRYPDTKIVFSKGCEIDSTDKSGFKEAKKAATAADVVLLALGESADMSGEAHSRAHLDLPGVQLDLIKELKETGKPIVLVLMNGRPLAIPEAVDLSDAVLETWLLGTEAGNAIADVISGDFVPSGKLPVTFPHTTGQAPIYYNHKRTGRPGTEKIYTSKYDDAPLTPLFPFGFGLSYTTFEYSDLELSKNKIGFDEELKISVNIRNSGNYSADEVAQLYICDKHGNVTRPVKELKGFKKVFIPKGETKKVEFTITADDLAFWDRDMNFSAEPGFFKIMVGKNSVEFLEEEFELTVAP